MKSRLTAFKKALRSNDRQRLIKCARHLIAYNKTHLIERACLSLDEQRALSIAHYVASNV